MNSTKYLITSTNLEALDDYNISLDVHDTQTSERAARAAFRSFKKHTNTHVYLLKVEVLDEGEGSL